MSGFSARVRWFTGLALAAVALAGCAEDKDSTNVGGQVDQSAVQSRVDAAKRFIELAIEGTSVLPDTSPREVATGKRVAIVVNGMNNPSAAEGVAGNLEACEAIGWECNVLDGQSNPNTYAGLVKQAVVEKVDAIIVVGIDCGLISGPLAKAAEAGIETLGQHSVDSYDYPRPAWS